MEFSAQNYIHSSFLRSYCSRIRKYLVIFMLFFSFFYSLSSPHLLTSVISPRPHPLRYLYCDEICLEPDTVLATLYAAKKYLVPHLAQQCVKFLEVSLTARNACLLLSQSRLFEEPELMTRCWEVIDAQVCECRLFFSLFFALFGSQNYLVSCPLVLLFCIIPI